jgi:hypothetical protein
MTQQRIQAGQQGAVTVRSSVLVCVLWHTGDWGSVVLVLRQQIAGGDTVPLSGGDDS